MEGGSFAIINNGYGERLPSRREKATGAAKEAPVFDAAVVHPVQQQPSSAAEGSIVNAWDGDGSNLIRVCPVVLRLSRSETMVGMVEIAVPQEMGSLEALGARRGIGGNIYNLVVYRCTISSFSGWDPEGVNVRAVQGTFKARGFAVHGRGDTVGIVAWGGVPLVVIILLSDAHGRLRPQGGRVRLKIYFFGV